MAKKKQSEAVSNKSTMVLRVRKSTIGVGKIEEKAKDNLKKHVIVVEKAELDKAAAQGKSKINDAGKRKRMAPDEEQRVKTINKNEMDKGAASGSTRVLRSQSAKKGDEALNEQAAVRKKAVKKDFVTERKRTTKKYEEENNEEETEGEDLEWEVNLELNKIFKGKESKNEMDKEWLQKIVRENDKMLKNLTADMERVKAINRQLVEYEIYAESETNRGGLQTSTSWRGNPRRKDRADAKTRSSEVLM